MTNALLALLSLGGVVPLILALLYASRGRRSQRGELPPPAAVARAALPAHPYREPGRSLTSVDKALAPLADSLVGIREVLDNPLIREIAKRRSKPPDLSRVSKVVLRDRTVVLSVTAENAGEVRVIQHQVQQPMRVRDCWATDWTDAVAAQDPAYVERCLALVDGESDVADPPAPREWWISDEPPVEAPANLDLSDADTLAYLHDVRARDERKVRARVHPAPGTSTEIVGLFNGSENFFPNVPNDDGIPTVTFGRWSPYDQMFGFAATVTVMVRFKRPGTFVIAFRGVELS